MNYYTFLKDANGAVRNDFSSALKRLAELADAEFTFIKQVLFIGNPFDKSL